MSEETQPTVPPGNPGRRPYSPPALVRYGDVRLLTQAGSGTLFENSATSGPPGCTSQVARRPCVVSDRRAKQNIVRVGTHPMGMGLYLFEYREPHASRFGNGRMFGVMADEVREVMPDAVERQPDGFDAVRYDLLGIELVH